MEQSERVISSIVCTYQGVAVYVGHKYNPDDVKLMVYYVDDPNTPVYIDKSEYIYKDTDLYIYNEGNNVYSVEWDNRTFMYIVKGIGINYISAVYNGPWIYKNMSYDTYNVRATIYYKDGHTELIPRYSCEFRTDTTLRTSGIHTHTVSFRDINDTIWTAQYMVECIAVENVYSTYKGYPILIYDSYDGHDVEVIAELSNGVQMHADYNDCNFDDFIINAVGIVEKLVSWTDVSGVVWNTFFEVEGIERPVRLTAEYVSLKKFIGDTVSKGEILAKVTWTDGISEREVILTSEEWQWKSLNVISQDNQGILEIVWEKDYNYRTFTLTAKVTVPYTDDCTCFLLAWYEGLPVEVGNTYDKTHVVIYLCEKGKDNKRLSYITHGIDISGLKITHEGDNWFTVSYLYGRYKLKADFPVCGIIYKVYPDIDFRVLYIHKKDLSETDMTEIFRPYFTLFGIFNLNWIQFMKAVKDQGLPFGMYRLDAPKNTGLFNKYASVWHVYCRNSGTLKAEIFKIYDEYIKEDNDNGSKKENSDTSGTSI